MTDTPEQRLPAPRPDAQPAPVPRFSAPPSAHAFELTPERAAGIVRQSASARWWGFLAVLIVVIFVIGYYFYELGVPGVPNSARLLHEIDAQAVTSVENGYNIYEANCARCHGVNGQGFANEAGAPPLNEQDKLFVHLNPAYIRSVLLEGGRYVCGNAKSLMPVWSNQNGGPLNYKQIDDLIAFLRATNDHTYTVRDPGTNEPVKDAKGAVQTFQIKFDNEDASVQHNVEIKDTTGKSLYKGDLVTGVSTVTYTVPALAAGAYPFNCTVHPNMTGTLTVK